MNIGMILDKEFYGDMRVENEVRALSSAGFKVFVFCFSFNHKFSEDNYFGATIVNIPVSRKFTRKLRALTNTILNFYPSYLVKLLTPFLIKNKINVLHIHDLYLFEVGLRFKKNFPKLILVGDLHENYVEGLKSYKFANSFPGNILISIPKWEKTEIEWCKKFDHLITVIDEAVDRYESLGIAKNKINVVANYVNEENFLSDEFDEEIVNRINKKFSLLYIGGFDFHRGLESVIKAMPRVIIKNKNIQLVLVGRGRNENELKQLSENLGVSQNVIFEGFQSAKLLPSYIKGSKICLIPHLKTVHTDNTIPHKLFHYMILEKPVVASNCNPIERIVKDSKCGLIYEANNENDLADKLIKLVENEDLQKSFGENGKFAVEQKYNWNETSKNLIKLYKSIKIN